MDVNYYHHRQQVSVFMSDNAACDCSRIAHRKMADSYASLIAKARNSNGSDVPAAANRPVN